jgi:hypothetical protein
LHRRRGTQFVVCAVAAVVASLIGLAISSGGREAVTA